MRHVLVALLALAMVLQVFSLCDDWKDHGGPKRCKRLLITHILSICGDFEAMSNSNPVENLSTCCCILGCTDEFLRYNLCPNVPAK
uniref:Insulin-like domain-containing protein n=1 Tax=Caenorhabditis japonica TaxID=281687 RepID=A0A8R1E8W5_CAEJA